MGLEVARLKCLPGLANSGLITSGLSLAKIPQYLQGWRWPGPSAPRSGHLWPPPNYVCPQLGQKTSVLTGLEVARPKGLLGSYGGEVKWQVFAMNTLLLNIFQFPLFLCFSITGFYMDLYCIRIRTRGGIYGQIYSFALRSSRGQSLRELLKVKGYIWPYIPSRFLIRTVYHLNIH